MLNYRQRPGLSGTQLVKLAKSPAHYKYYADNPIEPTPGMILGSATHCAALEPQKFSLQYAVFPGEGTRATKEYKDWAAKQGNKILLKADEYEIIQGCLNALKAHPLARKLLFEVPGHNEHELFWEDSGVSCKGQLDRWLPESKIIVDLKTCSDASEASFNKWKMKSMGYYLQSSHYQSGVIVDGVVPAFLFIAVETEAPYGVQVYELDQVSVDEAHEQRRGLLEVYKECMATGVWRSYTEEIKRI